MVAPGGRIQGISEAVRSVSDLPRSNPSSSLSGRRRTLLSTYRRGSATPPADGCIRSWSFLDFLVYSFCGALSRSRRHNGQTCVARPPPFGPQLAPDPRSSNRGTLRPPRTSSPPYCLRQWSSVALLTFRALSTANNIFVPLQHSG